MIDKGLYYYDITIVTIKGATVQGGLVPSKISGVGTFPGTNFGLLVHVLPGPNKQRALKPSALLS